MSLILNIDTSLETASVSIGEDGILRAELNNSIQKDHGIFLHTAIKKITESLSLELKKIDAIAVTKGPGSYTGLRVGMATAKGLCYALKKPLITIGTLDIMAKCAIDITKITGNITELYCPMIDARRMEVYTALFDKEMNETTLPFSLILNADSFDKILENKTVSFFGSGATKFRSIFDAKNASFVSLESTSASLSFLSFEYLRQEKFTQLIHSEPFYIKEFQSSPDFKYKSGNLHNKK